MYITAKANEPPKVSKIPDTEFNMSNLDFKFAETFNEAVRVVSVGQQKSPKGAEFMIFILFCENVLVAGLEGETLQLVTTELGWHCVVVSPLTGHLLTQTRSA